MVAFIKRFKTLILLYILMISFFLLNVKPVKLFKVDNVTVSPGKFSHFLGKNFPKSDLIVLEYPKSIILTKTKGELLFNVTLTNLNQSDIFHSPNKQSYATSQINKSITIYIPPEFEIGNGISSIWTSFTNDYNPQSVSLSKTQINDPIAPGWWKLSIEKLTIVTCNPNVKERKFLANTTQYIRIFNVTSPSIAGRYFFKVFITVYTSSSYEVFSIGTENFPTIIVSAGLNPAYISGVIKYCGKLKPHLYGLPLDSTQHFDGTILLPNGYGGKVYAKGFSEDGKIIEAQAYFNATAKGRYVLYGLEAGTYNITVQAAGYKTKIIEGISVKAGQSLENVDIYMEDGLEVSGVVYSKHRGIEVSWGYTYNYMNPFTSKKKFIRIEVTDLNENILMETPLVLIDALHLKTKPRDELEPSSSIYKFSLRYESNWDGHIPQDYANYTSGLSSGDYYIKAYVSGYVQIYYPVIHVTNETLMVKVDVELQKTSYFEFTIYFMEGSINRLIPSYTRVSGFLYAEILDSMGKVAGFNISYVPVGVKNFTIQVHGFDLWNRFINEESKRIAWIYARDKGLLPGNYKVNILFINGSVDIIALNALLVASPELREIFPIQTQTLTTAFPQQILELASRETSLYIQLDYVAASIGYFCNSPSITSIKLLKAGGLDVTFYSIDWEKPSLIKPWRHPGAPIRIEIYNSKGNLISSIYGVQPPPPYASVRVSTEGFMQWGNGPLFPIQAIGLKPDIYKLKVYTLGYLEDFHTFSYDLPVNYGTITDSKYNLIIGASIEVTLIFKTEGIFTPINNQLPYVWPINNLDATPARIELFNENGEFKAAKLIYIPKDLNQFTFNIFGFNSYCGNPRILWTNFYDTVDAIMQKDYGIKEDTYLLRVSIPGYYQSNLLKINICSCSDIVSVVQSVERIAYIHGEVLWINQYNEALPLSWASLTVYSTNGFKEVYTFTIDGKYGMWVTAGKYDFAVYHPSLGSKYFEAGLIISWGSTIGIDFIYG
ncbi:carboxypeptidase regulatory-like domain-containing protein [Candidatus Bathyarchaeota archaeon]|nr:carboxypeptidase regulatory-like domain-containing protein [Candidatus Bathyarchaeota archaeon]